MGVRRDGQRWAGPFLAWSLAFSFAAAVTVAYGLSSWLPAPPTLVSGVLRWVTIAVVSTAVFVGCDRVARRVLAAAADRSDGADAADGSEPRERRAGVAAVAAGALAAALGIAVSPSRAITAHDLEFSDPQPFVGGTPFTDDADAAVAASAVAASPSFGALSDGVRWAIARELLLAAEAAGAGRAEADLPLADGDAAPPALAPADPVVETETTTAPPATTVVTEPPAPSSTKPPRPPEVDTTSPPSTVAPTTTKAPPPETTTTSTTTSTSTTTTTTTTTTSTSTTSTTSTTVPVESSTTVAPATTVAPLPEGWSGHPPAYLVAPSSADTASQPVLALGLGAPPAMEMPNYDTDRDDLPGLVVEPSGEHLYATDPREVQRFRVPVSADTLLDGEVTLTLWLAADDFDEKWVKPVVALYDCEGEACTKLGYCSRQFVGDGAFQRIDFELGWVEHLVPAGHEIELRVAALDGSETGLLVAFGTQQFASSLTVGTAV